MDQYTTFEVSPLSQQPSLTQGGLDELDDQDREGSGSIRAICVIS
jgi:hypothetical protein